MTSPNDHEEPDCGESLHQLYLFLDGELTTQRRVAITNHLDDCDPCLEVYDFEAELRMVISQKCRDEVPPALRQRVADAIRGLETGPAFPEA